ncbi:hypothetical protein K437DRAFT_220575 [Tilletiaria anomala UBC 951]|uniref:Uncharacterized protein n=1 Tax=Tilletiaria anomala (strain ATCC 24038 / CBS 436.72 / UBC 951) TaxID=1037660 RepID=A0A066WP82_TILAU|nr:uncharacterized protein K437DRAFT_220575 [Tilletiaria anomala UBC 951]KDN52420.1 hypothetical protein K437DRAFT_220575 [Tilletiaria anomala UBC 951]
MSGGTSSEGEDHGPINKPSGANFVDLPVGTNGDMIGTYWTANPKNSTATHAFVMIHGRLRDGDKYWKVMDDALTNAVKAKYPGVDKDAIVVAPEYFSTKLNEGQYNEHELGWSDVNAWQAGEIATHPKGTTASAFDVLDAFVAEFADQTKYPAMKNVTLVGHGGGGQLMQRYAVVGQSPPSNVHVRYIYGDPSSSVYFTKDRPQVKASVANISSCPMYNTWRYGFANFTTDVNPTSPKLPIDYFAQYIQRDVVSMIGLQDVKSSGDEYCMAQLQGGPKRRDRNLAYWKYINTLAKTNFDLTGFNATFKHLPDWSNVSRNVIAHRLIVIENADHDAALVFGSAEGRAALFSSGTLPTGWRPVGWSAAGNGQRVPSAKSGTSSASNFDSGSGSHANSSRAAGTLRISDAVALGAAATALSIVLLL